MDIGKEEALENMDKNIDGSWSWYIIHLLNFHMMIVKFCIYISFYRH